MRRLSITSLLVAMLGLAAFGRPDARLLAQARAEDGLAVVFDPAAGVVRDTNGDGLPDLVASRVVVPDEPAEEDVLVAANLAGRLGFETVALTLPLVVRVRDIQPGDRMDLPLIVGRSNPYITALVGSGAISLDGIDEGQGLVALVPSPWGGGHAVAIAGGDDEGTLAAGNAFAAYGPRLWGASGSRYGDAERQVAEYLRRHRVPSGPPALTAFIVDADRRGLRSIRVRVPVEAARAAEAERVLRELDASHRRGRDAGILNFANVGATVIDLTIEGGATTEVTVRRSGLNPRALTPPDDEAGRGRAGAAGGRGGRGGAAAEAGDAGEGGGGRGAARPATFDLSRAFTIDGWFGDSYPDLMADRVDAVILTGDPAESLGAAHIAARLGLDSTGITLPLARPASDVADPAREPNPILVGRTNALVLALEKIGRARLDDLEPGEGAVEIVPRAFGNVTATVVAGADAAGTGAAAEYLARRAPYIWENARGSLALDHLTTEVRDVFRARTSAGQAALAVSAVDDILGSLDDEQPKTIDARVFLEDANPAFDAFLRSRIERAMPDVAVSVSSAAISSPVPVFEEEKTFDWEVDDFRKVLREKVLPAVKPGSTVRLDVRLSESPELRRALADEVRQAVTGAGASSADVRVRSAYKQGFLWMVEEVVPALEGRQVATVDVRVKEHKPDFSQDFRFHTVPTRWLHELYPIDEILRRDVGVPLTGFAMELVDDAAETYAVVARDRRGRVVYEGSFSPAVVEREYLHKFPGWSRVEVTTGWVSATVDGTTLVDERIATDPERFWDYYQETVLPRIHDHVMKLTNNRPAANLQPFHRDLDVEVWMSEPDFRIGIDEEQVSALESLHEDLYFVTLDFYNALGRNTTRARLRAPGKIYPIIHPERRGVAPSSRVLYAANAAPRARVEVAYELADAEKPTRVGRDLAALDVGSPFVRRVVVNNTSVREVEVELVPANDQAAAGAADLLDMVRALHEAGLYRDQLSYRHVDRLAFALSLPDARPRRTIPATGSAVPDPVHHAPGPPDRPLVTWDHVISPEESEAIVSALAGFPGGAGLSCRAVVPGPRDLGDGDHAADAERADFRDEVHGLQADDRHHGPAARERSVVDEPHPQAGRAALDRRRPSTPAQARERGAPPRGESGWRRHGVRAAEAHADAHAACRPVQRARPGRGRRRRAPARIRGAQRHLAGMAARHLPQSARVSVARVGPAVCRIRLAAVSRLLVYPRVVHAAVGHARSAVSADQRGHRRAA